MNHIVLVSVSSLSLLCMCMCVCVTHFASIGVRGGGAELDNNDVKVLCQLCTVLCTRANKQHWSKFERRSIETLYRTLCVVSSKAMRAVVYLLVLVNLWSCYRLAGMCKTTNYSLIIK